MDNYTVELEVTATAFINVNAESEADAWEKADAQGVELDNITEIIEARVRNVEFFQTGEL